MLTGIEVQEHVEAILAKGWYPEFVEAGGTHIALEMTLPDGRYIRAEIQVGPNGSRHVETYEQKMMQ